LLLPSPRRTHPLPLPPSRAARARYSSRAHRDDHRDDGVPAATAVRGGDGRPSPASEEAARRRRTAAIIMRPPRPPPLLRVVVAMSGGVDSSVAAHLLRRERRGRRRRRRHRETNSRDGCDDVDCHDDNDDEYDDDDDGSIMEVIGLHMSNWNALDEDSDDDDLDGNDLRRRGSSTGDSETRRRGRRRGGRIEDVMADAAPDKDRASSTHAPPSPSSSSSLSSSLSSSSSSYNIGRGGRSRSANNYCESSEREYDDARSVAEHLSMPLHRVSFASEYWTQVFEPFVRGLDRSSSDDGGGGVAGKEESREGNDDDDGVREGRRRRRSIEIETPNPDFGCNAIIKFGAMREYATTRLHADYVATGHYARLWHRDHYASLISSLGSGDDDHHRVCDFYRWMDDASRDVGRCVMESIAGLPEEEWILSTDNDDDVIGNVCDSHLRPSSSSRHYPMLIAGADRSKDQSYFLSGVKADAFRNVMFPLGHLAKKSSGTDAVHHRQNDEQKYNVEVGDDAVDFNRRQFSSVRDMARDANIPTATKRDSMGICFIGKRNFGNFVSQYLPRPPGGASSMERPGNFIDVDTGEIVGTHHGQAMHYTLGQGAKISGVAARYFVCGRGGGGYDSRNGRSGNDVYVCNSTHHPALYTDELYVDFDSFNWIGFGGGVGRERDGRASSNGLECDLVPIPRPLREGRSIEVSARTRHLQPLASCTVVWERNNPTTAVRGVVGGSSRGQIVVRFTKPIRAITPGQIVALYAGRNGLICLGGGPIQGKAASLLDRGIGVSLSDLHPSGHNDMSLSHFYES
jgi:tRNA U34 2-thiouridine synthase MnmA/TrmU